MTERKKDFFWLTSLLVLLILFYSKILFTDKIIRAPDIINEFYWGVVSYQHSSFWELITINLQASWNVFENSGTTVGGGTASGQFLVLQRLLLHFLPAPACVAWHIVLHLFFGAAGVYCCCRVIGVSRLGSFLGGLIFAVAPENASLLNAGHVMKIATISFAPWAFYTLEKGFLTRRTFWFMATGFVLAFQFFNTHWQIAYYTCLGIGVYGLLRSIGILISEKDEWNKKVTRLLGLNLVTLLFFLSTVAISLVPLASWSTDTNRGAQSGANQGKGGLDREEAMSWSLPPEELAGFIIPGFFGLSRQEAGENPPNISSYYWGRMVFTQTVSYMGLLPWLLLPLPLIFRRDRYTWLAVLAVAGGILFSVGKYTPFYHVLFDYFPGISRFRAPKMMMFIPVMGLGVLAARGLDLLRDDKVQGARAFRQYVAGIAAVPISLLVLLAIETAGKGYWTTRFFDVLSQPTRYESGAYLVAQRWGSLVFETGFAAGLAALCVVTFWLFGRRNRAVRFLPVVLLLLYLVDVGRINGKFMFLVDAPEKTKGVKTPVMEFLAKGSGQQYRVLPLSGKDPMKYASNGIPVMFTPNAVQKQRWQEFLDTFNLATSMPDLMNVRYLVYTQAQYEQEKAQLGNKFAPVFQSPDGEVLVLENRRVLPKSWLVPSVLLVEQPAQILGILQSPQFDPRQVALVESSPPLPLASAGSVPVGSAGSVEVTRYEGERIDLSANVAANSLLVLGEKYYNGWKARVDGIIAPIVRVNYIQRGVYLQPGNHKVEFLFDPLPFKVGKYLTLASFAFFAIMLWREWHWRKNGGSGEL